MSKRVQHWTAILEFFKHHLPNHLSSWAETWWETSEWLEQFFSDIKEGHALFIHLEILQTTYFMIICFLQCCLLSEIVAIPGHTHLFFAEAHFVNEIGGLCNASVARLIVSLIQHSMKLNLEIQRQQLQNLSLKQISCWLSAWQFTFMFIRFVHITDTEILFLHKIMF